MSVAIENPTPTAIDYPERDGKPLGETDAHRREMMEIIAMLQRYYAMHTDVYVSGNLMFYYAKGEPSAVVSPDVFVVKGVSNHERRTYKLWDEKHAPAIIFEITSRSTRLEDKGTKRELFAMLGVREYFLFDPLDEYLKPPLQGLRLLDDEFMVIRPEADGSLISEELGLRLIHEQSYLRLINIATGQPLLRTVELEADRQAEAAARQAAEERALSAEEENARLRTELARLRGEQK